jgi:hypothetical protein
MNHWSSMREADGPRVLIRYTEEADGWYEHEYHYYFIADDDKGAKEKALDYINKSTEAIDVFTLFNRVTKETILTEENI